MKKYGQDLKKILNKHRTALKIVENDINKRFDLILEEYRNYLTEEDKQFIINTSKGDIDIDQKVEIIIRTDANYVSLTSNQGNLFE